MDHTRRDFLKRSGQLALGLGLLGLGACTSSSSSSDREPEQEAKVLDIEKPMFFKISLAQWSLHRTLFSGELDNLDFAAKAKNDFGIEAVEYVNQFFKDKATDKAYLAEMKKRADDLGVYIHLIMIDGEGAMADLNEARRRQAVENHYKWVDAAALLGCKSIRVNAHGEGSPEEVAAAAVDGLGRLAEYAAQAGLNVLVENHGGYSSNGKWLAGVMRQVGKPNVGTLPDFGNFCLKYSEAERWQDRQCLEWYDRYLGVAELMPFAKAVSAKSHDFDAEGNETGTDYRLMMQIVKDSGYTGYVGIEYEGTTLPEDEGIRRTLDLLRRVGAALSLG
ncbi:MAG: sugar phosphate isomerase/epimerase [Bacteroidetes bacterium]|nr:MAG: sugar phosphate isomerase/epimerase [Bacteroidota bacterium]